MKKAIVALALVGIAASACSSQPSAVRQDQVYFKTNQARLEAAVPPPQLTNSVERQNIAARAVRFDNPDKLGYIYLISYGRVMAFYPIKGKPTSLNSYMVSQDQIVGCGGSVCTIQAPDVDGSFGKNSDGIFFFTPEGAYIEWQGGYMYSDVPLKLATQPDIVYTAPLK